MGIHEGRVGLETRYTHQIVMLFGIILAISFCWSSAQTASAEDTPPATSESSVLQDTPALKDSSVVAVKRFVFSGNTVIDSETLHKIVQADEGRQLSLSQLQDTADTVSNFYHEQGYFLARVVIPNQEVKDGEVMLQVIEGKIGVVVVPQTHYYQEAFIRGAFTQIGREKVIRRETLERGLLLLNENPGLTVKSALQAGKDPETTDILLEVLEDNKITGNFQLDNFGSRLTSTERLSLGVDIPRVGIDGSLLSLRLVSGLPPYDFFFGRVGYSIPIGSDGTHLLAYFVGGSFEIGREFAVLDIKGSGTSLGISVVHPFIKTRSDSLTGEIGLDYKDSDQSLLGNVSSSDRIRSLRVGANWTNFSGSGRNLIAGYLHQGLGAGFLGGMENREPFSSRPVAEADNNFTKLTLDAARGQQISPRTFVTTRLSSQMTTRSLVAGEQFTIGGPDTVRGYPTAEFSGDNGLVVSVEAGLSPQNMDGLQVVFFLDHGLIRVKKPTIGQDDEANLTGLGIGLRANLPKKFSLLIDIGVPVGRRPTAGGNVTPYFQIMKSF